jgi:hypothetical protein
MTDPLEERAHGLLLDPEYRATFAPRSGDHVVVHHARVVAALLREGASREAALHAVEVAAVRLGGRVRRHAMTSPFTTDVRWTRRSQVVHLVELPRRRAEEEAPEG